MRCGPRLLNHSRKNSIFILSPAVITPETPLEKLDAFFAEQQAPGGSKVQFALVTDAGALGGPWFDLCRSVRRMPNI